MRVTRLPAASQTEMGTAEVKPVDRQVEELSGRADVVCFGAVEQQAEHARREGGIFENSQDSFHTISPFTIVAQTAPVSVSPSKGERLLCV